MALPGKCECVSRKSKRIILKCTHCVEFVFSSRSHYVSFLIILIAIREPLRIANVPKSTGRRIPRRALNHLHIFCIISVKKTRLIDSVRLQNGTKHHTHHTGIKWKTIFFSDARIYECMSKKYKRFLFRGF